MKEYALESSLKVKARVYPRDLSTQRGTRGNSLAQLCSELKLRHPTWSLRKGAGMDSQATILGLKGGRGLRWGGPISSHACD